MRQNNINFASRWHDSVGCLWRRWRSLGWAATLLTCKLINAASVVCRAIINTNVSAAKTISLAESRSAMRAASQPLPTILLRLDHWIPGIRAVQHQLSAYQRRKSKEYEEEGGWTDWAREYPVYHYTPLALRKPGWILYFCREKLLHWMFKKRLLRLYQHISFRIKCICIAKAIQFLNITPAHFSL